jgi:hypothetical protein
MLSRATIQPQLKNDPDYEGLFIKESEREKFVNLLPGKPINFEHDDTHTVGKILSAFKSKNGEGIDILFETDNSTFKGMLSNDMIKNDLIKDVSMTVTAYKDYDKNNIPFLSYKDISEVSIVEKGDINGSNIHWSIDKINTNKKNKKYIGNNKSINKQNSKNIKMSEPQTSTSGDQIAEQLKAFAEQLAEMKSTNARLESENGELLSKNNHLGQKQQQERKNLVDNHVKKLFNRVMKKFKTELQPYEQEVENLQDNMIKNDSAQGLTQILASASSMMEDSFQNAEDSFQKERIAREEFSAKEKKYEEQILDYENKQNELLKNISNMSGNSFLEVNDRFANKPNTYSLSQNVNKTESALNELCKPAGQTIMGHGSRYFGKPDNSIIDDLVGRSELNNPKRFKVNDYMHSDNAHIFAKLDECKREGLTLNEVRNRLASNK